MNVMEVENENYYELQDRKTSVHSLVSINDEYPSSKRGQQQLDSFTPKVSLVAIIVIGFFVILLLGLIGVTIYKLYTLPACVDTNTLGASTASTVGNSTTTDQQLAELVKMVQNIDRKINYTGMLNGLSNILSVVETSGSLTSNINALIWNNTQQLNYLTKATSDIATSLEEQNSPVLNSTTLLNYLIEMTEQKLTNIVGTLSNLKTTTESSAGVVDNILLAVEELLQIQNVTLLFSSFRHISCNDIKKVLPNSPTGFYHINGRNTYCHMDTLCNVTGGWTRLASLDMTDATASCPPGFRLYTSGNVRACGRPDASPSCASVTFPSNGISYSQVCGRVVGYQYYSTDAANGFSNDINSYYVEGVSITRGSPRQHVWTLMSGLEDSYLTDPAYNCPCSAGSSQTVPSFVGDHYFCESGNPNSGWSPVLYTNDPLWDGQGCGSLEGPCCAAPGLPWFHRDYGNTTTTDFLELRVCADQEIANEDSPVSFYEIYVK